MRKTNRRNFLKAGLGVGAYGLLEGGGLWGTRIAKASALTGPTRLLTIYLPGGWAPYYLFCPFTAQEIGGVIPTAAHPVGQDPMFYSSEQVDNLDGTGDALDSVGFPRLRVPRTWNQLALLSGQGAPNNSNGWSWMAHQLWNHCSVVHGVDMGTNSHQSALISFLTGVASHSYTAPSLSAWVAANVSQSLGEGRPLGSVCLANNILRDGMEMGWDGVPTMLGGYDSLKNGWSEELDQAWKGLRNRSAHPHYDYWGVSSGSMLPSNDIEELISKRTRNLAGSTNEETDLLFKGIYDSFQDVSLSLAGDIVSVIDQTAGIEHLPAPFWNDVAGSPLGLAVNSETTKGAEWTADFDLALRLLKSNLATSVTVQLNAHGARSFDTHIEGHGLHYQVLRGAFDVIGRMLGEMAMTPAGLGKSLLDDTLVVVGSELGRTFPKSGTCDHWPSNSYLLAGGGVFPNRMCGGFDVGMDSPETLGYQGMPVALIDQDGNTMIRPPTSLDMVYSALSLYGFEDLFFGGNPGRVLGIMP